MREIPVYLFLGFLDSGKTTFIQETFEDPRFDEPRERTLLLVLEEGEIEYVPARFAVKTYMIETLASEALTQENLQALVKKHRPDRTAHVISNVSEKSQSARFLTPNGVRNDVLPTPSVGGGSRGWGGKEALNGARHFER